MRAALEVGKEIYSKNGLRAVTRAKNRHYIREYRNENGGKDDKRRSEKNDSGKNGG